MAVLSKNSELKFNLDNQAIDYPLNARDIQILATFDNESTQANITTETFEFVLEEAQKIRNYVTNGMTGGAGIFEGMPFDITTYNNNNQLIAFKGYLDLSTGFIDSDDKVLCNIKKSNGLNSLDDRLSALSFGYLESIGVITASDYQSLKYVVYNKVEFIELLMANVILFLLIKETYEAIRSTIDAIATVIGLLTASYPPGLGAFLYAIAIVIINAAYAVVLINAVVDMVSDMIDKLVPPLVNTKSLKIRSSLTKIAAHLGYTFESPIPEIDTYSYLPSNLSTDGGLTKGIPQSADYGYRVSDFFNLISTLFNAKYAIVGSTLHLRTENDPFWLIQSNWQMPDVIIERKQYNTEEFKANRVIKFLTDITDNWTIENFTGTNYEVITNSNTTNNIEAKYLKGLDLVDIPLALGNRKDELTPLEEFLATVAGYADRLINAFGGSSSLQNSVTGKIGYLKVSQNDYSIPKLLLLSGEKLPINHRAKLSAKYLYENYHNSKSFVSNNFYGQKEFYNDIKIPFGFNDFLQLINNSYFYLNGQASKIVKLEWSILQDYAIIDYWIRNPYTKNLNETFIEP